MSTRRLIIILLSMTAIGGLSAQQIKPGGVSGIIYWNKSQYTTDGNVSWHYLGEKGFISESGSKNKQQGEINHYPAMRFNGSNELYFPATKSDQFSELTFMSISLPETQKEHAIWNIGKNNSSEIVMTTRRLADLAQYNYINFEENNPLIPQIHTYSRKQTARDTIGQSQLRVGGKLQRKDIPVQAFKGLIPEILVFNRVLSYTERQRVESYLALKYGISLKQTYPTSYLDSQGKAIWDATRNTAYSYAIAGIGRDDRSGLNQQVSGSTETPGLLEIQSNNPLSDRSFLIWADNGEKLVFEKKSGEGKKLKRKWKASATDINSDISTSLYISADQFQEMYPLSEAEQYWLAVDHSGTGSFPMEQVTYYPTYKNGDNRLLIENIKWNKNDQTENIFTLVAAPEMFAGISANLPDCNKNVEGSVTAQIVGGLAPYSVSLRQGSVVEKTLQTNDRYIKFDGLKQGIYTLVVSDANKKNYTEDIVVANSDMSHIRTFETLALVPGERVHLDASAGLSQNTNYDYWWEMPDGQTSHYPDINIEQAGNYYLTVSNNPKMSIRIILHYL